MKNRATALGVALLAALASLALAGDGSVAHALRQAFGGNVAAAGAADGQALVWTASTRTWGPGAAGGSQTLAEVLAEGADGNGVSQTNLGSLALASGKAITNALHVVRLRRTTNQSIDDATNEAISWDTEDADTAGLCDLGGAPTKIMTATAAGWWHVDVHALIASSGAGNSRFLRIRRYSSADSLLQSIDVRGDPHASLAREMASSTMLVVASGDYLTAEIYQDTGGGLNVAAATRDSAETYAAVVTVKQVR